MITLPRELHSYVKNGPYRSQIIDHTFMGNPAPEKKIISVISRNGDFITNIYIDIQRDINHVKKFHKMYDKLEIEIGGSHLVYIPIDYIDLHHRAIHGVDLCILSDNTHVIIPVKLKELVNIPFILLPHYHECRLSLIPNMINSGVFDHNITRYIEWNQLWPDYETYINILPKDIWRLITEYLDDKSWVHLRKTCKFFYSLNFDNDIKVRYDKTKININDLNIINCNPNIMYHGIGDITRENLKNQIFINERRSITQFRGIFDNNDTYYYSLNDSQYTMSPESAWLLEWIIIEIDCYPYNILDHIKFEIDPSFPDIKNKLIFAGNREEEVYKIQEDPEFYKKMHQPSQNRYMYHCTPNMIGISLILKKKIHAKFNIFTSWKSCFAIRDDFFCHQSFLH